MEVTIKMAPPTTKPRLAQIDPQAVARDVAQSVLDHIGHVQLQLLGVEHISPQPEPEHTEIYRVVRTLAHYAVHGGELDASVHEYLISLVPLYSAVIGEERDVDGMLDADPETDLGCVIAGALARERLALRREPLTTRDLAVLGGLAQDAVGLLIRRGELAGERAEGGWRVSPKEARRWLRARGVDGV